MALVWTNQRVHVTREDMTYRVTIAIAHSSAQLSMTEMTDLVSAVIADQAKLVPGATWVAETLNVLFPEVKPKRRGKKP
jgi:hypothetical protein